MLKLTMNNPIRGIVEFDDHQPKKHSVKELIDDIINQFQDKFFMVTVLIDDVYVSVIYRNGIYDTRCDNFNIIKDVEICSIEVGKGPLITSYWVNCIGEEDLNGAKGNSETNSTV